MFLCSRWSGLLLLALLALLGVAATSDPQQQISFPDVSLPAGNQTRTRTRIALGSCSKQQHLTRIWEVVAATQPELWLWLGDAVYQDIMHLPGQFTPASPAQMQATWEDFRDRSGYARFLEAARPTVLGTWDDHDYGLNGGDTNFVYKEEAKHLFLDFLRVPKDDLVRRQRAGVYNSFEFGAEGQRVLVVLLDNRFHLDEERGILLGEEQWEWLDKTLRSSTAQLTLIGSGVQVLTVSLPAGENWRIVGRERQRLLDLVHETGVNSNGRRAILLSGDVHFSELLCSTHPASLQAVRPNAPFGSQSGGDPLVEFTSSGMTHSWRQNFVHPAMAWMARSVLGLMPRPYQLPSTVPPLAPLGDLERSLAEQDPSFRGLRQEFRTKLAQKGLHFSNGFGVIDVDWETGLVHLQAVDEGGRVHLHQAVPFLSPTASADSELVGGGSRSAMFACTPESPVFNEYGRLLAQVLTALLVVGLPWAGIWLLLNKVLGVRCCACCLRRKTAADSSSGKKLKKLRQGLLKPAEYPSSSDAKAKQS